MATIIQRYGKHSLTGFISIEIPAEGCNVGNGAIMWLPGDGEIGIEFKWELITWLNNEIYGRKWKKKMRRDQTCV